MPSDINKYVYIVSLCCILGQIQRKNMSIAARFVNVFVNILFI